MKQLAIYVVALALLSSCANQGNMAYYDDDGIYTRPAGSGTPAASGANDAQYFVDEGQGGEGQRSGEYYGNSDGDMAMTDDYVPEARSLPSESGRAYNNQRYNSPTYSAGYASAMPITMRMGYSSFHSPYGFGGGMGVGMGMGMSMGMGVGYMDPWWGMGIYDPWHPWYRWHRWNRWNSWYAWNMWSPYGPYGMCYGGWGYGMGYNSGFGMGYYMGVNSYYNNMWGGDSQSHNLVSGPRPGFMGGGFGSQGSSSTGTFDGTGRSGTSPAMNRTPAPSRGDTPAQFERPSRSDATDRVPPNTRTPNPDATRNPSARPDNNRGNDRTPFRWSTPRDNNPSYSRPAPNRSPRPNSGYSPPSRGGSSSPSMRPGSSSPSRNYSRPSTPSRSPSMSPSSPSRGGGGSRSGGGGGSRGGFRR